MTTFFFLSFRISWWTETCKIKVLCKTKRVKKQTAVHIFSYFKADYCFFPFPQIQHNRLQWWGFWVASETLLNIKQMTTLWFVVLCSLLPFHSPFYFVASFTNKYYIFIATSKNGPWTLGLSEKPQIEIYVQQLCDEIILRSRASKYRRPTCLLPVTPWLVNLLDFFSLAPGHLVYFYKRSFRSWAVILGLTSVLVSVCWSL